MSAKNQNEVEDPFDDEEIDINTEDGIDVSTQSTQLRILTSLAQYYQNFDATSNFQELGRP